MQRDALRWHFVNFWSYSARLMHLFAKILNVKVLLKSGPDLQNYYQVSRDFLKEIYIVYVKKWAEQKEECVI